MARDLARVHGGPLRAPRGLLSRSSEQQAPSPDALDTINRALHARQVIELVPAPDGVTSIIATSATRSTTRSRGWPTRSSRS